MEQEALPLLFELVRKQKLLLGAFRDCFPGTDSLLLSVPRSGNLICEDVFWEFQKHGTGIIFRELLTGIEIDVSSHLEVQDAVDGWRVATHLQSLKIDCVTFCERSYQSDDEGVRELLADMLLAGVIEPFSSSHNLLRINPCANQ